MSMRNIVIVVVVVLAFLGGIVWQSQMQKAQPAAPAAGGQSAAPGAAGGAAPPAGGQAGGTMGGQEVAPPPADATPGLAWTVPARWKTLEARSMRLATYSVPAAGGDPEDGECAVFYFGPSQGGGVEENLDRWVGQFDHPSQPERSQTEIAGFQVWRVRVSGAYLAPSGPMMQSSGTKSGYALNGAIVEGPNGRVFFKLTGPQRTIDASRKEFDALLRSLHRP